MTKLATFPHCKCTKCERSCNSTNYFTGKTDFFLPSARAKPILQIAHATRASAFPFSPPHFYFSGSRTRIKAAFPLNSSRNYP